MITGPQLREARRLLRVSPSKLASRAGLNVGVVNRAEASPGEPRVTIAQLDALLRAFNDAGIEFATGVEGEAGVRRRERDNGKPDEGIRPDQLTTETTAAVRVDGRADGTLGEH